ncbi:porin [Duganella dendranthematis]|jgi:predicted porin|uniref:Porin n=1 Tax=Duganella dendranthematis TaxID=2728021 RepID=A0ABX6MBD0_9BURK|nr:porin [Duganella dendranthematis]QJD91645.1 porin [Duganella dendranthematis]
MNKTWLATAVMYGLVFNASAQSNVTIYGIVDAGLVAERGGAAGNVSKVTSGVGSVSRLGFRGVEDLGGGLQALFILESGFKVDTGESDVANAFGNRQALVGLNSRSLGMLTFGRQKNPLYKALGEVGDPFGLGYAGTSKNLFPLVGPNTRTSNTVAYATPSYEGLSGEVTYSMGEQAGSQSAGRQYAAALAYSNGNLNTRLVYNSRNSDSVTPDAPLVSHDLGHNLLFVANYNFHVLKAFFSYSQDKGYNSAVLPSANAYGTAPKASTDSSDLLVGATVPVGARGTIMTSYLHKNDKQWNQDASQFGIGYSYAWTKRTNTYIAYAKINNKNGAGYTVGSNGDPGSGNSAFDLGIRHAF